MSLNSPHDTFLLSGPWLARLHNGLFREMPLTSLLLFSFCLATSEPQTSQPSPSTATGQDGFKQEKEETRSTRTPRERARVLSQRKHSLRALSPLLLLIRAAGSRRASDAHDPNRQREAPTGMVLLCWLRQQLAFVQEPCSCSFPISLPYNAHDTNRSIVRVPFIRSAGGPYQRLAQQDQ